MAAHPQLTKSETNKMVEYILSLAGESEIITGLPISGTYTLNKHKPGSTEGTYIFTASYTDKGGAVIGPLTAREVFSLRSPVIGAGQFDEINGAMKFKLLAGQAPGVEEDVELVIGNPNGYVVYKGIDLTGVKSIELGLGMAPTYFSGGTVEVRSGAEDGPVIANVEVKQSLTEFGFQSKFADLKPVEGPQDLFLHFIPAGEEEGKPVTALIYLKFSN